MANSLKIQKLVDGPRNAVVKVTGVLDTSDQALITIISPSDFMAVSPQGFPGGFRIEHIDYSISDQLELQLLWQAITPGVILPLAGRGRMSFVDFGGIISDAGAGANGAIDILTTGYGSGIQIFSLILEMSKTSILGVGRV